MQSLAFFESSVSERIVVAPNWFNAPLQISTVDAILPLYNILASYLSIFF
uniref:Uncharacterized protein n=1 Tax=uncultured marine virus TaxID=186617 RepID=A0A0F7L9M0_9VIRU|nr:hypothetical protein [uncultured marine virus]